jgi:TM2 domain-containing membrane protein YozV
MNLLNQPKKRSIGIILALIGSVTPMVGLHKFYLGQPLWGIIYFLLSWQSPMARIACAIDVVLYLTQDNDLFTGRFNNNNITVSSSQAQISANPQQMTEIATAIRELEKLRQDGLISEYEFEQKRRQLLT